MNRLQQALLAIVAVSALGYGVWRVSSGNGVATLIFEPPVRDVGTVYQGQPLAVTFAATNKGNRPVSILTVRPDCQCTAANLSGDNVIQPSGRTDLRVDVRTEELLAGQFSRSIRIESDDPAAPVTEVIIRGSVIQEFLLSQHAVEFNGSVHEGEVRVKGSPAIVRALSTDTHVSTTLRKVGADEHVLTIHESPSAAAHHSGVVILETSSQHRPEIRIPVRRLLVPE